ncbi:SDR family oxidoreductase [Pseudomonas sp. LMG 31766]|uniref:SDR family oxidoreductase n=1 Tax=Pseudomonas chaetocerotis TaxID=2758695 RepID=A0A931CTR2_9PSED|nr:SDR family oxidoreductase [Pseudomonas chaetocerotis]MBZ9664488.1 SDR family oxidoreductase [Pseudomonas chaetocerotis]
MTASRSILIIGASRGLGLGLASEFATQGWAVTATVRNAAQQAPLQALPGVHVQQLEMTDPASLEQLAERLGGQRFDVIFVNAGVAGPTHHSAAQATAEEMGQLFLTNAVAPLRVAERLLPNLVAEHGLIVFMSSILGSIEAGAGLGMPLYGASKAALNHLAQCFVRTQDNPKLGVLLMHPGWVRTDMGGGDAPLDIASSCKGMAQQVSAAVGQSGLRYLDHEGTPLPW